MWFWLWFASGREWDPHKVWLATALAAALIGAGLLTFSDSRSAWLEANARVESVQKVCELSSTPSMKRSTTTRVVVPCGQVEQFRKDNSGRQWTLREEHRGRVRLTGQAGEIVVQMSLGGYFGARPKVGDQARVLQNPESPTHISTLDGPTFLAITGYSLLALAGFLGVIAFVWF